MTGIPTPPRTTNQLPLITPLLTPRIPTSTTTTMRNGNSPFLNLLLNNSDNLNPHLRRLIPPPLNTNNPPLPKFNPLVAAALISAAKIVISSFSSTAAPDPRLAADGRLVRRSVCSSGSAA